MTTMTTEDLNHYLSTMSRYEEIWNRLDIAVDDMGEGIELYDMSGATEIEQGALIATLPLPIYELSSIALLSMAPEHLVDFRASLLADMDYSE